MAFPCNRTAAFLVLAASTSAAAITIEFAKLKDVRLPNNQEVTITGSLEDILIPVRGNGAVSQKKISDVMKVSKVALNYAGALKEAQDRDGTLTNLEWSVTTKKLPEGGQARLLFFFSGELKSEMAAGIIDQIAAAPKFVSALNTLGAIASSTDPQVHLNAAKLFVQEVAPLVRENFSPRLTMRVSEPSRALLTSLANIRVNFTDLLASPTVPGVVRTMTLSEAAQAVERFFLAAGRATVPTPDEARKISAVTEKAATFHETYSRLVSEMRTVLWRRLCRQSASSGVS